MHPKCNPGRNSATLQGEEENGAKHRDPTLYLPPINGGGTPAQMDRKRLLIMVGVAPICAWVFNPSDPPTGKSLDEMIQNLEEQRDNEFASHVCTEHTRTKSTKR
jgi:hypothetical protein